MRAAVVSNGSLEIQDRPPPDIAGDQVLVDVAAAGINRADLLQVRGLHPAPPGWPDDVPGLEFSGVVAATGPSIHSLTIGDRVFGIVGGGAHATQLVTSDPLCARVPEALDLIDAGGVPEVFVTAHDALVTRAGLRSGERVLIHGVGSGVGTAAVQLVSALGATSVGTARTKEKLERALGLGLDDAVEAGVDMAARIGEVDVVVDLVGGNYLEVDVEVCRPRGRIVIVGLLAGSTARVDLGAVMRKRLEITGTVLRARPDYEKATAMAEFARSVVPLFEQKLVAPVVDRIVSFEEIVTGYKALESNQTFGKVVIAMGG
jgi:NADPH:quinone reductase-like Zn-dependent oxidoreductase